MKALKNILYGFLAVAALGFAGCQDDFDTPEVKVPVAANADKVNTTIAQLKEKYWQDETNYCQEVGVIEDGEHAGEHYIIRGRVISSDYDGNIFKCLYIQDETAAIALSVNQYNLYMNYRQGQEVIIDATGMYVGKYNGMQQFGFPAWYAQGNCWETSFMAPALFNDHTELNGLPEPEKIDTITIKDFSMIGSSPEELRKYQGQLVRFNDCQFANPGTTLVDEYHSSGFNQALNVSGGTINVRTSGYARFWNMIVPEKKLDVVGILSYYGTGGWQLLLNDAAGLMNIGSPTENQGTQNNPFNVSDVISLIQNNVSASGWVTGYIAGAVAPAVTEVTSNDDIEWSAEVALNNTLVIAPTADCKEFTQCLIIELPDGSSLREYGNLASNPDNYGKQIWVTGNFGTYMSTYAVLGNMGTTSEWKIEGVEPAGATIPDGDGQKATPYNVSQVISGAASGTSVWVSGYIVGWIADKTFDSAVFSGSASVTTNLLLAPTPDETELTRCIPIQLPTGAIRTALNLQDHPENYKQKVSLLGSIEKYFGQPGVKTVTEYVLAGGGGTPAPSGSVTFTKATSVMGGKGYMIYADGICATPVSNATAAYGYLYTAAVTDNGGTIQSVEDNAFLFLATSGGYNIVDSKGRYLYMSGTYTSFQLSKTLIAGDNTFVWNPVLQSDGTFKITNVGNGKYIQYSKNYTSFGAYDTAQENGYLPTLYEMSGTPSFGPGSSTEPEPGPSTGAGSESEPYTVPQVIAGTATGSSVWVEGYIVGWIDGQVYSSGVQFNAESTSQTNLLLAPSADVTDPAKCIPVQLPSGAVRTALNLKDHPENYKQKVKLKGSVEKYFGQPGLKSVSEYTLGDGGDTPVTPPSTDPGSGTETSPYTIADVLGGATGSGVWVDCYVVGWIEGKSYDTAKFNADATIKTNLLVAASANETDLTKCVPVQLPAGAVRDAINMQEHPDVYKKHFLLKGNLETYFSQKGLKTVTEYKEL